MKAKRTPIDDTIYATQELIKRERFVGQCYLPGADHQGIGQVLFGKGNSLFITSCDFLEYEARYPNILCEPIADVALSWAYRAVDLAFQKVAFLLPVRFMETEDAKVLFDKTPIARVYVLTKRLLLRRGASAWFVWEKGHLEAPKIRWI